MDKTIKSFLAFLFILLFSTNAVAAFTAVGTILSANHNSSSSTWSPTTSATLSVGELGICSLAIDNISTHASNPSANTSNEVILTDDANNVWVKLRELTNLDPSAAAGASTALFYTKAKYQLTSGAAITATLSGSVTAKAMTCINFTMAATKGVYIDGANDVVNDAADPGSLTATGYVNVEHLWLRSMALETTGTTWTNTGGWTKVNASASAGSMASAMEFKISTSTSSGASDPTYSAVDSASVVVGLMEIGDLGCGRDTNQDGTVDNWCTGIFNCVDEDADGYCTNGLGPNAGIDCNDHDFFDYPDPAVGTDSGCSSGQAKACKPDGTYTSCSNFCPSDCSACYYIDPVSGDDATGNGTWATPWKTMAMFSDATSTPGGYHTRAPGECFGVKGSPFFSDMITKDGRTTGFNSGPTNDGTVGNAIRIFGIPGKWPVWTKANSLIALHDGASYYKISGFRINSNICNGYTNSVCVADDGGTGNEFYNLIGQGNVGNDNTGLVMLSNATNSTIHHVFAFDHSQSGGNDDNTTNFLGYRGTGNHLHDIVSLFISNTGGKEVEKVKHADHATDWLVERFIMQGGQIQHASRQTTFKNGLLFDTGIAFNNPGGTSFTGDELMQHLTIINSDAAVLSVAGYKDYNINGSGTSDRCTSDFTISDIVLRDSIIQDSDTSYANQDDRLVFVGTYDSDPMFIETVSSLSFLNTVFYNPNTTPSFGIFERNQAGQTACGQYGDYGGAYDLAGLASIPKPTSGTIAIPTTGSSVTNPSINSLGVATCGSCSDKGWDKDWGTAGAVPSAVPSFFNFLRFWGGRT